MSAVPTAFSSISKYQGELANHIEGLVPFLVTYILYEFGKYERDSIGRTKEERKLGFGREWGIWPVSHVQRRGPVCTHVPSKLRASRLCPARD